MYFSVFLDIYVAQVFKVLL